MYKKGHANCVPLEYFHDKNHKQQTDDKRIGR